ncbi:MAG: RNA-dependent DNA polymerase [Gloeocapsa sp. DLM2.Bin57]|nr:MAG: RNA-dependent DNA polymerase [Gloeocapsa sp. DLM2.Bin57]
MTQRKTSDDWKQVNWRKLRYCLFRLQKRIFKAVREDDMARAKRLQRLVMSSYAARMLAIRQVTQLNQGKKTAGVDGKVALTFEERFQLEKELKANAKNWKHQGLREVPIPKQDGTKRILKVPTIADRAWQCLVKFALEPAHEATFHERSYGFRPGRGAHDAQGVNPEFPEQGTPQGGVVSPLLANIALNGIETLGQSVRYADDMVFFLKPNEDEHKLLEKVSRFLAERGMKVSEKKTKVTASTDGFDFLGWKFYVQTNNGKFRSVPSEENFKAFREKVKEIVNNSNYGAQVKAEKLAPIIRGWRNYHKYCKMDGSKYSLWGINHRAYKVFLKQKTINRYEAERLIRKAFPEVGYSENKFVNVKGNKSPYDGDLLYWSKRNSALYDGATAKALKKQNHSCAHCGLKLTNDETVHLHHVDSNHNNWKPNNLIAVHQSCHQLIHMSKTRKV